MKNVDIKTNSKGNIRNSSIDITRFLASILVVMTHANFLYDVNKKLGYSFKHVFSRWVVPFFFCVMGYYFIKRLLNNEKPFKEYFLRLFKIYVVWSVIYIIFNIIRLGNRNQNVLIYAMNSVNRFFVLGTNRLHLWFFPAAFFCLIVVTLCHKYKLLKPLTFVSIILFCFTVLGSAYPSLAKSVPILSSLIKWKYYDKIIRHFLGNSLPFFCLGYIFNILEKKGKFKKYNNKKSILFLLIFFILFLLENVIIYKYMHPAYQSVTFSLYPFVFYVFFVLINNPMSKYFKISDLCKHLADFVYYSHILFRDLYFDILRDLFHLSKYYTLSFILTILTSVLIGYILYKKSHSKFIKKYIL